MNVRLTQIQYRLEQVIEELAKDGILPDAKEISAIARTSIKNLGQPTIDLIKMDKYADFPAEDWIQFISDVSFDLVVIRRILLDFYSSNKSEFIKNSTRQKKINDDIEEMEEEIASLLGISAGEYVDYINESFSTTNNIVTGHDSIDLQYGKAQLPLKRNFSRKVNLNLPDSFSPSIDIIGAPISSVIYSGSLPGSQFKECLLDTNHIWIYNIKTRNYANSISLEFIIPLPGIAASQVSIEPHSDTPMEITLAYSLDGNKYMDAELASQRGSELQFRFESELVRSIKATATISNPRATSNGLSEYIFGFKNISVVNAIYENQSSIETDYSESTIKQPIKTVEIESNEVIPDGCSVDYFVKGKSYGDVETEWMPVSPVNRNDKNAPTKVEISGTSHISQALLTDGNVFVEKFENIDLYNVGYIDSEHQIDINSVKLYRAINGWTISDEARIIEESAQTRLDLRSDKDVAINFYAIENATFIDPQNLTVKHDVDFNDAGQELTPRSKDEINPTTAIAHVKRTAFQSPVGFGNSGSGTNYYTSDGVELPVLTPAATAQTLGATDESTYSTIEPTDRRAPGDIFSTDTTTEENIVVQYVDGTSSILTLSLRSLMRIKEVTQDKPGIFNPIGSDFVLTSSDNIAIVASDGSESTLAASGIIEGVIGTGAVSSVSFSSHTANATPENVGATTRGFQLVPNDSHAIQSPSMFKNNEVDDMPTPFPVKIVTDSFSGVYEVDRVSAIKDGDIIKPILVITNPEKLGGSIPTASSHLVTSWEVVNQDLTQEVISLSGDKISFAETTILESGDTIEVKYRVSSQSSTIEVLPESLTAYDIDTKSNLVENADFKYINGIFHSYKEGSGTNLQLSFKYKERANNLYRAKTYLKSLNEDIKQVKIKSFNNTKIKPDDQTGEEVLIDGEPATVESVVDIDTGWHTVEILSKDLNRLISFMNALDEKGRAVFGISNVFSEQRGQFEHLTYADYESLKWSTNRASPVSFGIVDGSVIVPFNPNNNAFANNLIYQVYKGEDLSDAIDSYNINDISKIPVKAEEFKIEYNYYKTKEENPEDALTKLVKVKMDLKRSTNQNSALTPLVNNFKIRII